jgi:Protein of unknown function (DUF998)
MTLLTRIARTRRLLAAGIVAGPLFLGTWLTQALTREGFDLTRHPISLLALGDGGWIQIANFVVTGALYVGCAAGLRRALGGERGGTWGPRLIGAFGFGLIVAGAFVADAGAGFPAGAPAGAPVMSWHGLLHELGHVIALLSWTAAAVVFARRFRALGQRGAAVATVASILGVVLVSAWPDPASFTVRIVLATAIQFAFVAAVAASQRHAKSPDRSG